MLDPRTVFLVLLCYNIPIYKAVAAATLAAVPDSHPTPQAALLALAVAIAAPPPHAIVFAAVHLAQTQHPSKIVLALAAAAIAALTFAHRSWLAAGTALAAVPIALFYPQFAAPLAAVAWAAAHDVPYINVAAALLFLTQFHPKNWRNITYATNFYNPAYSP
jgi:hypothetical protein